MDKAHQAAHIFLKAAEYIETYGWQVSGMGTHGKPRCSMGALASAHADTEWDPALARLMYTSLTNELNGIGLTEFNRRANSGADVARLFRTTAQSLLQRTHDHIVCV